MNTNKFNSNVGFKVTIEFSCPNMIDEETLNRDFGGDLMKAYKFICDDFRDNPYNFSEKEDVVKVERLKK